MANAMDIVNVVVDRPAYKVKVFTEYVFVSNTIQRLWAEQMCCMRCLGGLN